MIISQTQYFVVFIIQTNLERTSDRLATVEYQNNLSTFDRLFFLFYVLILLNIESLDQM